MMQDRPPGVSVIDLTQDIAAIEQQITDALRSDQTFQFANDKIAVYSSPYTAHS